MAVKRRQLLRLALGAGVALTGPFTWLAGRISPVRYVEAVRCGRSPSPRKTLDESEIAKMGRWAG